jgi:hypothetical protein
LSVCPKIKTTPHKYLQSYTKHRKHGSHKKVGQVKINSDVFKQMYFNEQTIKKE